MLAVGCSYPLYVGTGVCSSVPVNRANESLHNYCSNRRLGNVLLKSPQGERVREIQSHNRQGSSRAVLYDIFQTWLTEEDNATWDKLVQHLYKVNLTSLAERIEGRLRMFELIDAPTCYDTYM